MSSSTGFPVFAWYASHCPAKAQMSGIFWSGLVGISTKSTVKGFSDKGSAASALRALGLGLGLRVRVRIGVRVRVRVKG